MIHNMKLQPEYYNYILYGTKRIEIRLFDLKRQKINIGDTIRFFKEPNLSESFDVKVIGLLRYGSFKDMFLDFDISILADKDLSKDKLLSTLSCFYTDEMQKEYGVVGIRFELI